MKRKLLAVLLLLVLSLSVFSSASACSSDTANYAKATLIVRNANAKILGYVVTAQLTPYDDVDWLMTVTEATAAQARAQVEALGYTANCTYTYYFVDGRWVAIDPLYVVNPLPNKDKGNGNGNGNGNG